MKLRKLIAVLATLLMLAGMLPLSAVSAADAIIPEGTLVRVLRIEGVKVYVEEVKEEIKC